VAFPARIGEPPKQIGADLYRYQFTPPGGQVEGWWKRSYVGEYLPPMSVHDFEGETPLLPMLWRAA